MECPAVNPTTQAPVDQGAYEPDRHEREGLEPHAGPIAAQRMPRKGKRRQQQRQKKRARRKIRAASQKDVEEGQALRIIKARGEERQQK